MFFKKWFRSLGVKPNECIRYMILYEEMERRIIKLETEIKLLKEGRI